MCLLARAVQVNPARGSIVAMLARLQVPGQPALNAGLLLAVVTVVYYAPFEPLATAIVAAASRPTKNERPGVFHAPSRSPLPPEKIRSR